MNDVIDKQALEMSDDPLKKRIFDPYAVVEKLEIETRLDGRFMIVMFGDYVPLSTLLGGRLVMTVSASRARLLIRHYVDDEFDEATVVIADCPDPKPELLEVCRAHEFIDVLIYNQTENPLEFQNLLAWIDQE